MAGVFQLYRIYLKKSSWVFHPVTLCPPFDVKTPEKSPISSSFEAQECLFSCEQIDNEIIGETLGEAHTCGVID
jgi:hypothetical protein